MPLCSGDCARNQLSLLTCETQLVTWGSASGPWTCSRHPSALPTKLRWHAGQGPVVWGLGALAGSPAVRQGIENDAGAPVQARCAGRKPCEAL